MAMRTRKSILVFLFTALLVTGCSSPEEKEAAYLKRGNEYFEAGKFDQARLEYKNAARIRPADPEVAYRMGLVEEATGNFAVAYADFTRAEQQNAGFRPAVLKIAQYRLAAEQFDEVKKRVDAVLATAPDDPGAHALRGALLLNDKDYKSAEKECRFALSKDPANIIAYSILVGLYLTQGDDDKAISVADDGIAHNPKNLSLLLLKSQIYERTNNLPKIAETFAAIFKLAPDEPHYRIVLAIISFRTATALSISP